MSGRGIGSTVTISLFIVITAVEGPGNPCDRTMDAVVASTLDRTQHPACVIGGLIQPQADHLARARFLLAKADQDMDALGPELMSGVGVDGRNSARSFSF